MKRSLALTALFLLVILPVLTLCGCQGEQARSAQADPKEYKVLRVAEFAGGDPEKYRAAFESRINEEAKQGWKVRFVFMSGKIYDVVILGR